MPRGYEEAKQPGRTVSVATGANTLIADADRDRAEITITNNDAAAVVYLRLGAAGAAIGDYGIRLNANGGNWTSNTYLGAVNAWQASGGAVNVLHVEV